MKFYIRTAILMSLVLLVANCLAAAGAPAQEEDVAAIKSLFEKHLAAFNAGDEDSAAALYTDDAILMPPDREQLRGKASIQWGLRVAFQLFTTQAFDEGSEIEIAGDWAFAKRTHMMSITSKTTGAEMELKADWLDILKRQPDGQWKIYRQMVTSDRPPPGAEY